MQAWKVKTIRLELAKSPRLKSINSQQGYLDEINGFELWRDDRPISGALIELYLKELKEAGRKPSRINFTICALRWWVRRLAYLAESIDILGTEELEEILRAREEVKSIHALQLEPPRQRQPISKEEFSALVSACEADVTAASVRDSAIFSLAYYLGLHRDEITGLDLEDFTSEEWGVHSLVIRSTSKAIRKVLLDEISSDALVNWLAIRGSYQGALFCSVLSCGRLNYRYLSGCRLHVILKNRCKQAGIRQLTWGDLKK